MSPKIKIFIASSNELKVEREKCIPFIHHLSKSHHHLILEPVEWEHDVSSGSFPGYKNIQGGINPKLEASDIIVFMFHSKIGRYTREEFEIAMREEKKVFAFFKKGFSPDIDQMEAYKELLDFKKSLNDTVLYKDFSDIDHLEKLLYADLNFYLSDQYKSIVAQDSRLSENETMLLHMLAEKEDKIKALEEGLKQLPDAAPQDSIKQLREEIKSIRHELGQSEEMKQQLANDKAILEQQLSGQKEKEHLKAKALEAVEKGDYDEAEMHLKQSAEESIIETAATFYELAKIKKLQLQFAGALEYYELAANIDKENDLYLNEAGLMAIDMGLYDKAIVYCNKALTVFISQNGEANSETATYYINLSLAYRSKGFYSEAIDYCEKALDIGKRYHGEEHPIVATSYNNLGSVYWDKGEYDEAIGYYEKALLIDKKCLEKEHPKIAIRYNNLGSVYLDKGEYDKAIDYGEKALLIDKKYYGEEHPDLAINYNNLGSAYQYKGFHDEAISYLEKAILLIDKKYRGEQHPNKAIYYNNLGLAYSGKGAYNKAIDYYEKALTINKKYYGEQHPNVATCYNNLGTAYIDKQIYGTAIDYFNKALVILKQFLADDHPNMLILKKNLEEAITASKDDANKNGPVVD